MRTSLVALAVLLLAGCSSTPAPSPTTASTPSPAPLSVEWMPKLEAVTRNHADCSEPVALSELCAEFIGRTMNVLAELRPAAANYVERDRYTATISEIDTLIRVNISYRDCRGGQGDAELCPFSAARLSAGTVTVAGAMLADEDA
jgi:hypothetical protein